MPQLSQWKYQAQLHSIMVKAGNGHRYNPQTSIYSFVSVCVCVFLYNFIASVALCNHRQNQHAGLLLHHRTLVWPLQNHTHTPKALAATNLFSMCIILLFQDCYLSFAVSVIPLRSLQVAAHIAIIHFFLLLHTSSLCGYMSLFIHSPVARHWLFLVSGN